MYPFVHINICMNRCTWACNCVYVSLCGSYYLWSGFTSMYVSKDKTMYLLKNISV